MASHSALALIRRPRLASSSLSSTHTHTNYNMSGRGKGKTGKKAVSRSAKAGLQFRRPRRALPQGRSTPPTSAPVPPCTSPQVLIPRRRGAGARRQPPATTRRPASCPATSAGHPQRRGALQAAGHRHHRLRRCAPQHPLRAPPPRGAKGRPAPPPRSTKRHPQVLRDARGDAAHTNTSMVISNHHHTKQEPWTRTRQIVRLAS